MASNPKVIASFPPGTRIKLLNDGRMLIIEPDCPLKIGEFELTLDGDFQLQTKEVSSSAPRPGSIVEWELHGQKG